MALLTSGSDSISEVLLVIGIAGRNIIKQSLKKGIKEKISTLMTVCFTISTDLYILHLKIDRLLSVRSDRTLSQNPYVVLSDIDQCIFCHQGISWSPGHAFDHHENLQHILNHQDRSAFPYRGGSRTATLRYSVSHRKGSQILR
jgi:hypothetical protein